MVPVLRHGVGMGAPGGLSQRLQLILVLGAQGELANSIPTGRSPAPEGKSDTSHSTHSPWQATVQLSTMSHQGGTAALKRCCQRTESWKSNPRRFLLLKSVTQRAMTTLMRRSYAAPDLLSFMSSQAPTKLPHVSLTNLNTYSLSKQQPHVPSQLPQVKTNYQVTSSH